MRGKLSTALASYDWPMSLPGLDIYRAYTVSNVQQMFNLLDRSS